MRRRRPPRAVSKTGFVWTSNPAGRLPGPTFPARGRPVGNTPVKIGCSCGKAPGRIVACGRRFRCSLRLLAAVDVLEPRVDRLALQREHAEAALVHPA